MGGGGAGEGVGPIAETNEKSLLLIRGLEGGGWGGGWGGAYRKTLISATALLFASP
jgi:hypothetical protein